MRLLVVTLRFALGSALRAYTLLVWRRWSVTFKTAVRV